MPIKKIIQIKKIVEIQKRIVKLLFLKNGQFNEKIEEIPREDAEEFNKLFAALQQEFAKNREKEVLAKLLLWKKNFLKLEEICQKKNLFKKLEKLAQIEDPIIIKEFTKYANINFTEQKKAENLFSFFCQEKNILLIEWLMTNKSFQSLCENKGLQPEKLNFASKPALILIDPPLPIITKSFLQAIANNNLEVACFLLETENLWISTDDIANDKVIKTILNTNDKKLIQTMVSKIFLNQTRKRQIKKYNKTLAELEDQKIFVYLNKFMIENKPAVMAKLFDNGLPVDFIGNIITSQATFLMSVIAIDFTDDVEEKVELLVNRGASCKILTKIVNSEKISREVTPLQMAISNHRYKIANLLIELNKKVVTYTNNDNLTALMLIIYERGPLDLIEKLITTKKETLYVVQKSNGYTAFAYAISVKDEKIIKILLAADPELVNKNLIIKGKKYSPLMFAVEQNPISYEVVELLLQNGANPNFQNDNLEFVTPFAKVAAANDSDALSIMALLHKYGADINVIDGKYLTPFSRVIVTCESNLDIRKFFVEQNVNLNTLNADGHTILTLASKNGDTKVVVELLEKYQLLGIDINSSDKDGNTPLHWAVKTNNIVLTRILLRKYEAKIDVVNNKGDSALDLIQASVNKEIKNIFNEKDSGEITLSSPEVFTNDLPIESKRNFCFRKQKNELAVKSAFVKTSNSRKNSHRQVLPAFKKTIESEGTKKTNSSGKVNQQTRSNFNYQPGAENIIKSLNYMAKKEVQDRAVIVEQKQRKAIVKEDIVLSSLEGEEQNISNLEQSANNNEYYQFIAKLRKKLAINIDNDFYVVKRENGRDHEGGRPAIKIYESKGSKNKQLLFGFISSIKEGKKPAQSLTFSLENDRDSYLREINWANKNEVIGKWKTLNVDNKVQPKITTAHKVEIANLVALEHLQTIFATEFIDFNYKQTKAKFEQINLGATTSGAIAQLVSTEQFSFPECLAKSTIHYENDNDFYYQKVKNSNYDVKKPLDVEKVNVAQNLEKQPIFFRNNNRTN